MNTKTANGDTCGAVRRQLALLLYGELSFDEEELVESHLAGCAECRAALEREQELHAAFQDAAVEPPATLLRECREDLEERLRDEPAPPLPARKAWWDRWLDALTLGAPAGRGMGWLRPAGALAARVEPELPGEVRSVFPAEWLEPLRAAAPA